MVDQNEPVQHRFFIEATDPNAPPLKLKMAGGLLATQESIQEEKRSSQEKVSLVVDTNILLKQTHLHDLLRVDASTFDEKFTVVTLDSVISEVRDPASREYINTRLPYPLDIKEHQTFLSKADIDQVSNFAKDTGDFISLSKVDIQVIALGVAIAKKNKEEELINKEPKDLDEFKPEKLKEAYDKYSSDSESDQSDEEADTQ